MNLLWFIIVQGCADNKSNGKAEDSLERQKLLSQLKDQTDALLGCICVLYACESWTLTVDLERRIQATEMRCFRRLFGISYRDHVTNGEMGNRIREAIGPHEELLAIVKKNAKWNGMDMSHDL